MSCKTNSFTRRSARARLHDDSINMNGPGYLYLLYMKKYQRWIVKMGFSKTPKIRAKDLSLPSGVPGQYEILRLVWVPNMYEAEKALHIHFDEYRTELNERTGKRKEFFGVVPTEDEEENLNLTELRFKDFMIAVNKQYDFLARVFPQEESPERLSESDVDEISTIVVPKTTNTQTQTAMPSDVVSQKEHSQSTHINGDNFTVVINNDNGVRRRKRPEEYSQTPTAIYSREYRRNNPEKRKATNLRNNQRKKERNREKINEL